MQNEGGASEAGGDSVGSLADERSESAAVVVDIDEGGVDKGYQEGMGGLGVYFYRARRGEVLFPERFGKLVALTLKNFGVPSLVEQPSRADDHISHLE